MSEQAQTWAGEFGNDYTRRSPGNPDANREFFLRALAAAPSIKLAIEVYGQVVNVADRIQSVIEFGCGSGANLEALRQVLPSARLTGVEINELAIESAVRHAIIYRGSMLDWATSHRAEEWDLAFTKGVLIHIRPIDLPAAYEALHRASRSWILVAEYYNPTPVEITYRGEQGMLWKRDFAGEMLDRFPDLKLVDYGFAYHRDEHAPQDDLTWFLMQKRR